MLAGAYARAGCEELTLTAARDPSMQWSNAIAPGIVTWLTRGIHLGCQRSFFSVHIDDVSVPDSRWSMSANCTPGDACVDRTVTTPDIRMSAAGVGEVVAGRTRTGSRSTWSPTAAAASCGRRPRVVPIPSPTRSSPRRASSGGSTTPGRKATRFPRTSGTDGACPACRLSGLPAGPYTIWVQSDEPGFTNQWHGGASFDAATPLTVSSPTTLNITLNR